MVGCATFPFMKSGQEIQIFYTLRNVGLGGEGNASVYQIVLIQGKYLPQCCIFQLTVHYADLGDIQQNIFLFND